MLNASGQLVSQNQYKFTNYDFRHGLPITHIKAIAQDSLGFIWLGSSNGIARFDGYTFKHFVADDQDSAAISGNDISVLKVAPDGNVWIGTHDNGISVWDYNSKSFKTYSFQPEQTIEILKGAILDFHFWEGGDVWVCGAKDGLYKLDPSGVWEQLNTGGLKLNGISSFLADPFDPASVYFGNQQLYHFDARLNHFKEVSTDLTGWAKLKVDQEGRIWGSKYFEKLNIFNPSEEASTQLNVGKMKRVSGFAMLDDQAWVGSIDGGVYTIDLSTLEISNIKLKPFDPWSLPTDIAPAVYRGDSDMIWIGTSEGVSLLDPSDQLFQNIRLRQPGLSSYIEPHSILPFHNQEKHLIAPYYFKEMLLYDLKAEKYQIIPKSNDAKDLHAPEEIWNVDQKYWILYSNGLGYLDDPGMKIKKKNVNSPGNRFGKAIIIDANMDDNQNLWVIDLSKTVYQIDLQTGVKDTFHVPFHGENDAPRSIESHSSGIWIGLGSNIVKLDPSSRVKTYFDHSRYPQHRKGNNDIHIDDENHIWVATYRDILYKYKLVKDSLILIKSYDLKDGLAGKTSGEIVSDENGDIYVSSAPGFAIYDKSTDRFQPFNKINGLISNRLNGITVSDGKAFITTHSGYSYVDTKKLKKQVRPPKVILSSARVGNEEIKNIGADRDVDFRFKYDQNDFYVEYVGLNLSDPLKMNYQYRLLPDTNWIQVGAETRSARYPNLKSDNYTFQIEASLDGAQWGNTKVMSFQIIAPFWEMWWFRALILLLVGGMVYTLIKWREKQIKSSEQMRTQMAELELKALRSQMNPHFMFNSLNSIKNYILKSKPTDAAQYLSSFAHLIRLTLQNSREKTISLSQEIETLMLYIDLEKLRFKKGFEFTCEVDEQLNLDEIQIPPLLLQPYVENAIWHGLMHKEGEGVLSLGFQKKNGSIECVIDDNGIGREKAASLKSSSAKKYKSMGMGITKDRIDILNQINALGIEVDFIDKMDNAGIAIGTKVVIQIPDVQKDQKKEAWKAD